MVKKKRTRAKKWKSIDQLPADRLTRSVVNGESSERPSEPNYVTEPRVARPRVTGYRVERWRQIHPPNLAMLRHTLTTEGYTVYQWADHPGSIYATHKHPTDQCHWIVSGTLEIDIEGGGTYLLEAGDRDLMPANTYHSARVVGDETVIYLIGEVRP